MGLSVLTVTLGAREDVGVDAVEVAVVEVGGGVLGSQGNHRVSQLCIVSCCDFVEFF